MYYLRAGSIGGPAQTIHHMKTKIAYAAAPAVIAIAALLLSFRSLNADNVFAGIFCVAGLAVVAMLDYRVSPKKLFNR